MAAQFAQEIPHWGRWKAVTDHSCIAWHVADPCNCHEASDWQEREVKGKPRIEEWKSEEKKWTNHTLDNLLGPTESSESR